MPELIAPAVRLHAAWLEAHAEWGPGLHEDGFGLHAHDEVASPAGFAAWVERLTAQSDATRPAEAGRVHCTYRGSWTTARCWGRSRCATSPATSSAGRATSATASGRR